MSLPGAAHPPLGSPSDTDAETNLLELTAIQDHRTPLRMALSAIL